MNTGSMYMESGVRTALSDILYAIEYDTKEEAARLVRALLNGMDEVEDEVEVLKLGKEMIEIPIEKHQTQTTYMNAAEKTAFYNGDTLTVWKGQGERPVGYMEIIVMGAEIIRDQGSILTVQKRFG